MEVKSAWEMKDASQTCEPGGRGQRSALEGAEMGPLAVRACTSEECQKMKCEDPGKEV